MASSPYQLLQKVKDQYDAIGVHFSETRKKQMQLELAEFAKRVQPGLSVLDVGCGSGRLLKELVGKKVYYTGLDFSKTLINQAKQEYPRIKFLERDITTSEGWEGIDQFDAVFCLAVLHHIPDRKRQHDILAALYAHTKPGGFVIISVWNLWNLRFLKLHLKQWRKKLQYRNLSYLWVPYSVSNGKKIVKLVKRFCKAYFAGELLHLVKQVGYRIDTFYYAKRGKTHLSMFTGENFCILARKSI